MEDTTTQGQQEPHGDDTDYKALYEAALKESRKWESRSKANADKARAYDALADGGTSPEDRLAAVTSERDRLRADAERAGLVARVAEATGVSASIVSTLNGADEETLTAQAKAVSAVMPHGAPSAPEAGQFPGEKAQTDSDMRKFVRKLTGRE